MQGVSNLINTVSNKISFANNEESPFIFDMVPASLSNVPFHKDTHAVKRFFAEDFPFHMAVHEVSPLLSPPPEYTQPHHHDDCAEINIILSRQVLVYRIQLGNHLHIVSSNSSIYIPQGITHSANVLKGTGFFVTMRIPVVAHPGS